MTRWSPGPTWSSSSITGGSSDDAAARARARRQPAVVAPVRRRGRGRRGRRQRRACRGVRLPDQPRPDHDQRRRPRPCHHRPSACSRSGAPSRGTSSGSWSTRAPSACSRTCGRGSSRRSSPSRPHACGPCARGDLLARITADVGTLEEAFAGVAVPPVAAAAALVFAAHPRSVRSIRPPACCWSCSRCSAASSSPRSSGASRGVRRGVGSPHRSLATALALDGVRGVADLAALDREERASHRAPVDGRARWTARRHG